MLSRMHWSPAEHQANAELPIESREALAREYPGESLEWVLRPSRSIVPPRLADSLRSLTHRVVLRLRPRRRRRD
jgi:hypothetical protein